MSLLIYIFAVKKHKNMKYNILKITFLLLVAIFNVTIGIGSLPLWAYILIEFISIILLVYVSVRMFSDNNLVIVTIQQYSMGRPQPYPITPG